MLNTPITKPEHGLTPRIERLRKATPSEGEFHEWHRLWAEGLRRAADEPLIVRRAAAFAHMCDHMDLELPPGALIAGRHPRTVLDEATREELRAEWRRVAAPPNDSELHHQDEGLFRAPVILLHLAPATDTLLRLGFGGLREWIRRRLQQAQDPRGRDFYRAALMTIEAAQRFAARYAALAHEAAAGEGDPHRRQELQELSRVCARVVGDPPESFREALQLVWFVYLLTSLESAPLINSSGPGALDRSLIDYYRRDVTRGKLTPEDALELLQCCFIEMNYSCPRGGILPLAIGGLAPDGAPVENELTWLCLKAVADLQLLHPSLALRCHSRMSPQLLRAALRSIGSGCTYPALFNDDVCVPSLQRSGVSSEDSFDWVHSVCTELTAAGKTYCWIAAPYLNLVKCLELALNNGRCLLTGRQLGEDLGDLTTCADFEQLYASYLAELSAVMSQGVAAAGHAKREAREHTPYPFLSCFTADCLEVGRDYTDGGCRYNPDYVHGIGLSTVIDSLIAIKQLVFDERSVPPETLLAALRSDFKGFEELRFQLLNRVPKYGNDDDLADEIARRVVRDFYREVEGRTDGEGGRCFPGFMTWESHNLLGKGTGASAEGRTARAALSDSVGAVQGMDRKGLTALLRSVMKLDFLPSVGGVTFNIKVSPEFFTTDDMLARLEAALRAYFQAGGFQVQVNVIDKGLLEAARAHPETHRNLIVRVGGFSAYFVELDPGLQDEIVARTLH
ncbi:MAG: hypothetical protein MUQ65_16220 [Armatimonadetes bacterium]|nr:hypothetical protein [Armatimonadota bacterium]